MSGALTVQLCSECGADAEMDFLQRLLTLDEPVLCDKCRRKQDGDDDSNP